MTDKQQRRFWANVDPTGNGGRYTYNGEACWIWQGYIRKDGYGGYTPKHARPRLAHRIAYELAHGPVPQGLELDHECRNKACVLHVRAVTHRENMRNTDKAQQTHCCRGHALTGRNVIVKANGCRNCRTCKQAQERARYWERKEEQA